MTTKHVYKDAFAVIGKAGQGYADDMPLWIPPLWDDANANFEEIANVVRKDKDGAPLIWGAMTDIDESNKRWGEAGLSNAGKYMASSEADIDAIAPKGWTKWIIPAQTYLVISTTMDEYGDVFVKTVNELGNKIIGSVQEFYPEPGNPYVLDVYFPIAAGKASID